MQRNPDSKRFDSRTTGPRNGAHSPAAASASSSHGIDLVVVLRAFCRKWKACLLVGSLLAVLSGSGTWFVTDYLHEATYTSSVMIEVKPRRNFILKTRDTAVGNPLENQLIYLKSPLVLSSVLRDEEISRLPLVRKQTDPIKWLEGEVNAGYLRDSDVLKLTMKGTDPGQITKIINRVKEVYFEEVVDADRKDRLKRVDYLEKMLAGLETKVQDKRQTIKSLAETLGTTESGALALKQQHLLDQYFLRRKELTRVQFELMRETVRARTKQELVDETVSTVKIPPDLLEAALDHEVEIAELREEIARHEHMLTKTLLVAANTEAPRFKAKAAEVAKLKADLEKRRTELSPKVSARLVEEIKKGSLAQIAGIQDTLRFLKDQEKALKEDVAIFEREAKKVGTTSFQLESLKLESAQVEGLTATVSNEIEALKVEIQAPARVKLISDATVPKTPDPHDATKMLVLASLAAFGFGAGGITAVEFLAHRVATPKEVTSKLGLEVVGSLPALPSPYGKTGRSLARTSLLHSLLTEAIDSIRTVLIRAEAAPRLILVTSAVGREGKTTLSCHLATSLARSGKRTLLLDFDLRCSSVHLMFDVSRGPGIMEILRGEEQIDSVVQQSQSDNLDIITSGEGDFHAALACISKRDPKAMFDELLMEYDYIILDSAPILPVADTLQIAPYMDIAIMSMLHGESRLQKSAAACQKLRTVGANVFGAVIGRAKGDQYGYGYGYSYGYGSYGYSYHYASGRSK